MFSAFGILYEGNVIANNKIQYILWLLRNIIVVIYIALVHRKHPARFFSPLFAPFSLAFGPAAAGASFQLKYHHRDLQGGCLFVQTQFIPAERGRNLASCCRVTFSAERQPPPPPLRKLPNDLNTRSLIICFFFFFQFSSFWLADWFPRSQLGAWRH